MEQSVNFCLSLAGLGMMLVGIAPMVWWKFRSKISGSWIWWGISLIWLALGIKTLFGFFLNARVQFLFTSFLPPKFSSFAFFLYIGLLTFLTEVWLTYQIIRSRLAKVNLNEAAGFGLGYGGAEAAGIGFYSFLTLIILILAPQILPQAWRQEALSSSCYITVLPVLERTAAVGLHLLVSLWLWQAASQGKMKFFVFGALLKGGIDSLALPLQSLVQTGTKGMFLAEMPILILGIAAFVLLINFFRPPRKIINILGFLIFIFGFTALFSVLKLAPKGVQTSNFSQTSLEGQPAIDPACIYPVVMSGQGFEPMIPQGTRLMMNKCIEDKNNLTKETIVLFKQNGSLKLRMIMDKEERAEVIFYQVSRRLNAPAEETINAQEIIAIWQPQ